MTRVKKLWIGLGALLVLLALLALLWLRLFPPRWAVERYILTHQEALNDYACQLLETDPVQLENYHGWSAQDTYHGWQVSFYPQSGKIEFQTSAFGLAPSSSYPGFYYAPSGEPMGYQGVEVAFEENGSGWSWEEPEGDNRQYTEQITGNWYWFEATF